jgi:hypothetical protein
MAKLHLNRSDDLLPIILSQQTYVVECFWCELKLKYHRYLPHSGRLTHRDYTILWGAW